jgi:hypothetical protein
LFPLTLRGLVYGLARMHIDGHLPPWGVAKDDAEGTFERNAGTDRKQPSETLSNTEAENGFYSTVTDFAKFLG